jgi:TonB-linked SusC/RagA family outer membrane protein
MLLVCSNIILQAQPVKITLDIKEGKIEQALAEIQKQSPYKFLYNTKLVDVEQKVTIKCKDVSLNDALDKLFAGKKISYKIVDNQIILSPRNVDDQENDKGSQIIVKGLINDISTDTPVPGVIVQVKGGKETVFSDQKGYYEISVPGNGVLTYYCMGMKATEAPVNNRAVINVNMEPDIISLSDIVVTGYQTISKERATGSFTIIDTKMTESKLQPDLKKILEGQAAGLTFDNNGNVSIRGTATINANIKPLIVVDGFQFDGNLEDINPINIENITVLKDAVSASIYGTRAANGVIVITTKRGQKDAFKVSYRGVFSARAKTNFDIFNFGSTSDIIDGEIAYYDQTWFYLGPDSEMSPVQDLLYNNDRATAEAAIDQLRNFDAVKEMEKYVQRTLMTQSHNIGISGGSEKSQFNAAINYVGSYGDKKSMIHEKSDKLIFDLKNSWTPAKWVSFDMSANVLYTKSQSPLDEWSDLLPSDEKMVNYDKMIYAYSDLFDASGNSQNIRTPVPSSVLAAFNDPVRAANMLSSDYNPIADLGREMSYTNSLNVRLSGNFTFKLFDGFSVNVGGAWRRGNINYKEIREKESFYVRFRVNSWTDINNSMKKYLPYGDILDETRSITDNWTIRYQANYNKSFNDNKHRVTALLGGEIIRDQIDGNTYPTRFGYNRQAGSYESISYLDWKSGTYRNSILNYTYPSLTDGKMSLRDNRYTSWYGNASYEYNNRYIVSGSARLDLTNFFGTDPKFRYKPIWSAGATWKIANEEFFNNKAVNVLNLRASYGINGNIALGEGPYLILAPGSYNAVSGGTSYSISSPVNDQLRWEKTATTNIGFDLALLQDRFGASVDLYYKLSTDLLASDAVNPTTGFANLTKNVGSIRNRGIEASLRALVVKTSKFDWDIKLNFSYNDNKILTYNKSYPYVYDYLAPKTYKEGFPVGAMFAFKSAGLDAEGYPQVYDRNGDIQSGYELFTFGDADLEYMGNSISPYEIALTNSFSLYNFDVSFMFVSKLGGKMRMDSFTGMNYTNRHFAERWQNPGDENKEGVYPVYDALGGSGWQFYLYPYYNTHVVSSDFLKLRDLSVAYNVPERLTKKIGLLDTKIYLQGRNLFRITAKGVDIDPETQQTAYDSLTAEYYIATVMTGRPEIYLGLSFNF